MNKHLIILFLLLYNLLFSPPIFAWDAMGHRIIAVIAYDNLTPPAKEKTNLLISYMANAYPYNSTIQTASSWADLLKQQGVHAYDDWHFEPGLNWALNQSLSVLKNPRSNYYEQAFFLRFLLHLTGDAHQPLHCIANLKDRGGNLAPSPSPKYSNLHAYWDDGAGLFQQSCGFSKSKPKKANCFAQQIEKAYPKTFFKLNTINNLNPQDWISECSVIAKEDIYAHPHNDKINQIIVQKQLALAGYRLANVLNTIF